MNDFAKLLYEKRKTLGLTQQNVADRLNVTNKAVSKWEAGESFPETALLVPLADILGCSVDEMLRGINNDISAPSPVAFAYDTDQNADAENAKSEIPPKKQPLRVWQATAIVAGVVLILFGLTVMLILGERYDNSYNYMKAVSFLFITISVAVFLFVFAGVSHESTDAAEENEKPRARRLAVFMAIGCTLATLSIAALLFVKSIGLSNAVSIAVMFAFIALSVIFIIPSGIGLSHVKKPTVKATKKERYSGIIMSAAAAIYLFIGFVFDLWHPGWIVFPIGGILCGILSSILGEKDD